MGGVAVRYDASEVSRVLDLWRDRGKRTESAMALIAEEMVADVQEEFETEGHGEWPDLAESTLAARRRQGRGAKMLQDTGRLAGSIVADSSGDYAEAFTNVDYGKFHVYKAHGASSDEWKKVPKRDFMDIDLDRLERNASELLLGEITG